MIDRVLNLGVNNQESYYFQLIPLSLTIINQESELPVHGTTYRFTISKGTQKFDENKIPIHANFQNAGNLPVLVINSCRLNFQIQSYIKQRKLDFSLKLVQRQNNQDYDLGQYAINVESLITKFKENNMIRHQIKSKFTDDYELDFEIYIEKNRMALQKHIRQNKVERINKSPLRQRSIDKSETPKREFNNSIKKTIKNTNEQNSPSRDREEQFPVKTQQNKEGQVVNVQVSQEVQNIQEHIPETSERIDIEIQGETESKQITTQAVRQVSQKRGYNSSEKNQITSQKSKEKVPLITSKYKPLKYEGDGKAEVKMSDSQRLPTTNIKGDEQVHVKKDDKTSTQQKIYLTIFLIISMVIMYFAMHPNKKV